MRRGFEGVFQKEEAQGLRCKEQGVRGKEIQKSLFSGQTKKMRRDARAVEGARLEIVCSDKIGTEGSNPSLSAIASPPVMQY